MADLSEKFLHSTNHHAEALYQIILPSNDDVNNIIAVFV